MGGILYEGNYAQGVIDKDSLLVVVAPVQLPCRHVLA